MRGTAQTKAQASHVLRLSETICAAQMSHLVWCCVFEQCVVVSKTVCYITFLISTDNHHAHGAHPATTTAQVARFGSSAQAVRFRFGTGTMRMLEALVVAGGVAVLGAVEELAVAALVAAGGVCGCAVVELDAPVGERGTNGQVSTLVGVCGCAASL
jgi:K+ transporter